MSNPTEWGTPEWLGAFAVMLGLYILSVVLWRKEDRRDVEAPLPAPRWIGEGDRRFTSYHAAGMGWDIDAQTWANAPTAFHSIVQPRPLLVDTTVHEGEVVGVDDLPPVDFWDREYEFPWAVDVYVGVPAHIYEELQQDRMFGRLELEGAR